MALSIPWMGCISTLSPSGVHRQQLTSLHRPLTVPSEGHPQDWMESPGQFHLLPETHAAHASAVSGMWKWKEPGILVSQWVVRNVYDSEQSTQTRALAWVQRALCIYPRISSYKKNNSVCLLLQAPKKKIKKRQSGAQRGGKDIRLDSVPGLTSCSLVTPISRVKLPA